MPDMVPVKRCHGAFDHFAGNNAIKPKGAIRPTAKGDVMIASSGVIQYNPGPSGFRQLLGVKGTKGIVQWKLLLL